MEDTSIIQVKICCRCKKEKNFVDFNKCKSQKFGLHNHCRECQKEVKAEWVIKNTEWVKEYGKQPHVKEKQKQSQKKKYDSDLEYREKTLEKNRIRRRKEPAKIKQRLNEKFRRETNINYKLGKTLRSRINTEIRKIKKRLNIEVNKSAKTIELLGCSIFDFMKYLELKFLPGMSWGNHGFGDDKWHIDHIIPCAAFDLAKEEDQRKCFHYTNMQPLWQKDNLSKNDFLENGQRAYLLR